MLAVYILLICTLLPAIEPRPYGESHNPIDTNDPAPRVKRFSPNKRAEDDQNQDLMMRIDLKYGGTLFRATEHGRGQKNKHDWLEQLDLPGLFRSFASAVGIDDNRGSGTRPRSESKPNYYQVNSDTVLKAMNKLLKSGAAEKIASELAWSAAKMYRRYSQMKNTSE